jgi:hypothetical protein
MAMSDKSGPRLAFASSRYYNCFTVLSAGCFVHDLPLIDSEALTTGNIIPNCSLLLLNLVLALDKVQYTRLAVPHLEGLYTPQSLIEAFLLV